MKTILLMTIAWALTTSACFGQRDAMQSGSAEAFDFLNKHLNSLAGEHRTVGTEEEAKRRIEINSAIDAGRSLFGADPRWSDSEAAGTLLGKPPTDFRIGDWGRTSTLFEVVSKVSGSEFLAIPKYLAAEVMLVRGLDTSKVTDGVVFILQYPVVITGTYSYTAVSRAQKTVLVLECHNPRVDVEIDNARFRTWTVGKDAFLGKFVGMTKGKVHLERKEDRKIVEVPFYRLSKKDQKFARAESKLRPSTPIGTKPKQPLAQTVATAPKQPLVQTVATAAEKTVDRRESPKDDDRADRSRYVNPTYGETVRRVNGKWEVVDNKTGRVLRVDEEVSRTKDSVELFSPSRKQAFRLLPTRIEQQINGKWQWVANGHWDTSTK